MNYGDNGNNRLVRPPLFRETDAVLMCLGCGGILILFYIATTCWYFSVRQIQEIAAYILLTLGFSYLFLWHVLTRRRRTAEKWPPIRVSPRRDHRNLEQAWRQDAVVLGYDAVGNPWLWPDRIRVMQGIVLGQTGSGKTTLLRNIITQDLSRRVGSSGESHKIQRAG